MSIRYREDFNGDEDAYSSYGGRASKRSNSYGSAYTLSGKGRYNVLTTVSFAELYHRQEISERLGDPLEVGPGVGPNPFAEQRPIAITVLPEDRDDFRAKHPEDAVFGNWVPNVNINDAYRSIMRSEIMCGVIRDDDLPRWANSRDGDSKRKYPRVFTSFTNFKKGTDWQVLGAIRNPGAGRGRDDNVHDKSVAALLGGTISVPHSGPYSLYIGDKSYYLDQTWSKPVDGSDPTGSNGFITMCPMKGLDRTKRFGMLIPINAGTIDDMLASEIRMVNRAMDYEIFSDYSRDQHNPVSRGPPSELVVKNFIKEYVRSMEDRVQGLIPDLTKMVQIHVMSRIISTAESYALMNSVQADSNGHSYQATSGWKSLIGTTMMQLVGCLQKHYNEIAEDLPACLSKEAWRNTLPFVLGTFYNATSAYSAMPPNTRINKPQILHVKEAASIVFKELRTNIDRYLSNKFVGTVISNAEPNCPVDINLKQ